MTVTEKFVIATDILNAVAQLQIKSCKSSLHLFKYSSNKNHHNYHQRPIKSISRQRLSNHESSKIFLNIIPVVVTTYCMFHRYFERLRSSILLGLADVFCKNTGRFVNIGRSRLRVVIRKHILSGYEY